MPDVFWIGVVLAAVIFLIGVFAGARSRTTGLLTGAALVLSSASCWPSPLLALGLAGS